MTSPRIALSLSLAAFALTAAPAAADPVPLLASRSAQSVEISGTDVIVARPAARGGARVDALPTQGGPARRLLTVAPRGRGWRTNTFLAASPQRVAAIVEFAHTGAHHVADRLAWQLYTGPASGPLTLVLTAGIKDFAPFDIAVDGDRVLVSELQQGTGASRLVLLAPGAAARVLPWPGAVEAPVALAGNHAAFVGTATPTTPVGDEQIFVLDPTTGARQATIDIDGSGTLFDLAPDGHVVAGGVDGLFTAGVGQPRTPLSGGEALGFPNFAGAAVAGFESGDSGALTPAVVDPGAGQARPIGVATFDATDIAADATGVAWIAHDCVLFAPLDSVSPDEPPAGPCPRSEVEVESPSTTMTGRTIRLTVACVAAPVAGCRGSVALRRRHATVGRKRFHVTSGRRRTVKVRLSKRVARLVRTRVHHGKQVVLQVRARVVDGGDTFSPAVLLDHVRGA